MNKSKPPENEYQKLQKERARAARKAAYQRQKAYIKKRKDAQKADLATKKHQTKAESLKDQLENDARLMKSLVVASDVVGENPPVTKRPLLRLVKSDD